MSKADDYARLTLRALVADGGWTPNDVFHFARQREGSAPTYEALRRLGARGWIEHHAKGAETPERWTATEKGERRAARGR